MVSAKEVTVTLDPLSGHDGHFLDIANISGTWEIS